MVVTVGTGTRADTNIVAPLVKTIEDSNPDFVVFVCTGESEKNTREIVRNLGIKENEDFKIFKLRTVDDLEKCFTDIAEAFRFLTKREYENGEIDIDFTSGTKAMTSALVLAGLAHDCGKIKYISGERRNGVVIGGTERFYSFVPNRLKAYERLNLAKRLIYELRFDTARDLLEGIDEKILDDFNREKKKALFQISVAYGHWDRFMHKKARGEIEKANIQKFQDLKTFALSKETKNLLVKIGGDIEKEGPTWEIMADIYCNARRRFDEGKYDDALARIYRLTEMLAQWVLLNEYGIETSNIDVKKVPDDLHPLLENNRNNEGKIQTGLMKDYEILNALEDKLGQTFQKNNSFQKLLKKRNRTILAHGFFPVNEDEVGDAFKYFEEFALLKNPGFKELCRKLTFPWRKP